MIPAHAEAEKNTRNVVVDRSPFVIPGIKTAAAASGMRYRGRPDMVLIAADKPATAAGVFTQNRFCAAPVSVCREHLQTNTRQIKAIVANAGIANACTGEEGYRNARETARLAAKSLDDVVTEQVLVASTGVIGMQLKMDAVAGAFPDLIGKLREDHWEEAAKAIMTTDTVPKLASTRIELSGTTVTIGGIAKGSGMIAPNMATLLAFVCTDAAVESSALAEILTRCADRTFNRVSVDGDTSTNDTLLALVSGQAGNETIADPESDAGARFEQALEAVLGDLAKQIVLDAEGATKFIELRVSGADSQEDARRIAFTIAHSPLVKTAFFGEDPNWGRIVAAAGRAGAPLDPDRTSLAFDGVTVLEKGIPLPSSEVEARAAEALRKREIAVHLDLALGPHEFTVHTCDLSYDYVKINADYRS